MIKTVDLKKILKDNGIKFYSYWDKKKLADIVKEHGLYPEEEIKTQEKKRERNKKNEIINYDRLKTILKNPRQVTLEDVETGECKSFPSIYKAGKFIDKSPQTIENWNGRIWNGKYKISIK